MTDQDTSLRFGGIGRLYGDQQLAWLSDAHFCVIGIGGVGSWAAEALARTGIGHITLIDLDDICVTNINRQLHAVTQTVGEIKAEAMKSRLESINPNGQVTVIDDFITQENIKEYIQGFDYVIDCIDAVKEKAALIAHCKRNKIPVITTGGAGGQTDPSQISFGDVAKTTHDPLLAKVRYLLRKQYNFTTNPKRKFAVDCVYSTEQLVYPTGDGEVCKAKQQADGSKNMDCATGFGSATMVTGSFGFFAAAKSIRKYLDKKARASK
ncbi:sulfur acceptor protein CsdL [Pseudoalteromonas luteoviolacea]|uniref:tRNA threonylcarbamoyladenosine dehydratase n=1 Tax=Pseudoalteromonas luteoviolacea TaxID=43657 RepID=A0A023Q0J3_9GAMM|nr:tRNA cyclic N6-threonylcarbamoyladenosine(37) synthase TcdA [Pseudoalteromonas luteoviolacea]AHX39627.1 HesA/MoeB/ThiF family protein [Pseudoalteromonas luteoviolacea]KID56822.1 sulfur acceptor protein CsdL [Pseudoalteromonas luteoviolacea]